MGTLHNTAEKGQIAKKVLMPGDPLRAKFIAEKYLENAVQVNAVRNMFAYTGTYKGSPVTVMGSGMGMPSIGIYSYELFEFYDVDTIIRAGSAVSYEKDLVLQDVVIGSKSCSQSSFAFQQSGFTGDIIPADPDLMKRMEENAKKLGIKTTTGVMHSSDVFYYQPEQKQNLPLFKKYPIICGEMETFALFHNASVLGKKAAAILTISDTIHVKAQLTPEEREKSFDHMIRIALESLI